MKFYLAFITVITISLPVFAASDSLDKLLCARSADDIQRTLDNINIIDGWVESVPPDEATYFAKEYKAALDDADDGDRRFNLVVARPYFYAWQLHESLAKARGPIQGVQSELAGTEKLKNKIILAVLASHLVSHTRLAFQEYLTAENIHSEKMSNGDTVLAGAESGIDQYLNCLIGKLDEK